MIHHRRVGAPRAPRVHFDHSSSSSSSSSFPCGDHVLGRSCSVLRRYLFDPASTNRPNHNQSINHIHFCRRQTSSCHQPHLHLICIERRWKQRPTYVGSSKGAGAAGGPADSSMAGGSLAGGSLAGGSLAGGSLAGGSAAEAAGSCCLRAACNCQVRNCCWSRRNSSCSALVLGSGNREKEGGVNCQSANHISRPISEANQNGCRAVGLWGAMARDQ